MPKIRGFGTNPISLRPLICILSTGAKCSFVKAEHYVLIIHALRTRLCLTVDRRCFFLAFLCCKCLKLWYQFEEHLRARGCLNIGWNQFTIEAFSPNIINTVGSTWRCIHKFKWGYFRAASVNVAIFILFDPPATASSPFEMDSLDTLSTVPLMDYQETCSCLRHPLGEMNTLSMLKIKMKIVSESVVRSCLEPGKMIWSEDDRPMELMVQWEGGGTGASEGSCPVPGAGPTMLEPKWKAWVLPVKVGCRGFPDVLNR